MIQDEALVGVNVASLGDNNWDSYLVQMVYLRYARQIGCQMVMEMASLRYLHWDSSLLVKKQELM